jgi:hypothetical protein
MTHLPADTPTLQLIAYVSLTFASVIFAGTSLVMAYRQNFGWKPIMFPVSFGGGGGKFGYSATMEFEFWNRKKYPVTIRFISVEYKNFQITREGRTELGDEWGVEGLHKLFNEQHVTVEPNGHKFYKTEAPIEKQPVHDYFDNVTLSLFYFDPIKNRIKKLLVDTDHTLYLERLSKTERFIRRLQFWK